MILSSGPLAAAGFAHGFSTRRGGVSEGAFASLNLGRDLGDAPDAVAENHRRLAQALGYAPGALVEARQVHGDRCAWDEAPGAWPEADALFSSAGGAPVAVRTADCVPVLLADRQSGAVAAVHAGWRGAVAGILPRAVRALAAAPAGGRLEELLVAIGPHIRVDAFEVGEEVAERIQAAAPSGAVIRRGVGRPHADLAALLRCQLAALGVRDAQIDDVGGCTFGEPERFFSHRRDRGHTGRQLSVILPRPT